MTKDEKRLSAKYLEKLDKSLNDKIIETSEDEQIDVPDRVETREYEQFKGENLPSSLTLYEKVCNQSEKILKIKPSPKKAEELQEAINTCHLSITPTGAVSFGYLLPMMIVLVLGLPSFILLESLFLMGFFTFMGIAALNPLANLPQYFEKKWRMQASKQMVISVFYVVTYMRHTSNLEKAIYFAAEHLSPPLSLDFKRILWNVEVEKSASIKESLDEYLEQWRGTNMEFVEAFHMIQSSLYEGYEERRLEMLDKSLDIILDGTYERMLHFAQNLKGPINALNMLGVILPILGLVILPLVVSFMDGVYWYHIAAIYNVGIPVAVYLLGKSILVTRPGGSGDTTFNFSAKQEKKLSIAGFELALDARTAGILVGVFFLLVGLTPIMMHIINPDFDLSLTLDPFGIQQGNVKNAPYKLLDYQKEGEELIGPFGLGASLLSVCIPMGLGLGLGIYFKMQTGNVIEIRKKAKRLELEFSSALFQLGNRLGDGYPAELAFGKVADVMQDTVSGRFFSVVNMNIKKMGLGIHDAIFNPKNGAAKLYPSNLIESSMKVLIQSIRKGPLIAAQAMSNVARYVKEIHKVNERLKDLMAEIVSSMSSQVSFLTPAISGIVVGITSMITSILGRLTTQMSSMGEMSGTGATGGLLEMFGTGLPTYYFQIIVGIYVVQLAYILTTIMTGIDEGEDDVILNHNLGKNMIHSTLLYCVITFIVMLLFNIIASAILGTTLGV
ncbi:MAG: hypothetical protein ACLFP2_05035 [Candidatus Woesearchaeota archaeon]